MNKLYFAFLSLILLVSLASADYGSDSNTVINGQVSANTNAEAGANVNANANSGSASETASANDEAYTNNRAVIQISGIDLQARVKTKVNFSSDRDSSGNLRAQLSNGRYASIRILPETASATAQARINASCERNNCTLELKEVGSKNNTKLVYEVETKKDARFFGIFKTKATVKVQVDAETGEVIAINKPWWASIKEDTSVKASGRATGQAGY